MQHVDFPQSKPLGKKLIIVNHIDIPRNESKYKESQECLAVTPGNGGWTHTLWTRRLRCVGARGATLQKSNRKQS